MRKRNNKEKKLSLQKIFNIISFTFILACCVFYGGRFIKLYLENNKTEQIKVLADTIKENNKDNLKNIKGEYYFFREDINNYIKYSNINWRIIKINQDNTITITTDNSLTSLAAGEKQNYNNSHLNSWLNNQNKDYTGILENALDNKNKYLTYTNTCINNIDDTKNIECTEKTDETYITIPSLYDYINTGSNKGFMNNDEYYYLINSNSENKLWYVNNEGKIGTSDGTDIIGIKPVITIKNTVTSTGGDGSINNPYTFEQEQNLLGSYVKLGNDTWRIYNIEKDNIKLSLNNFLTINNEEIKYKYSNNGYYHNDTKKDTLAYYLNKEYLNTLSYKDIINEIEYSNGMYNNTNNYDYTKTLETKVKTKVSLLSIGDIILNTDKTNHFTSTGLSKESNLVYTVQDKLRLYGKISTNKLNIMPTISIKKELLTKGTGTFDNPLEVE